MAPARPVEGEPDASRVRPSSTDGTAPNSRLTCVVDRLVGPVLRIDTVGSALIGVALVVAPGWLASGLGTSPTSSA